MPDSLASLFEFDAGALELLIARLILAWLLGLAVTVIYRRARPMNPEAESFTVTLVLLTILIAMVTQVIGDNVARAFSLVGALSIVRFRTVVRDTRDTAFVIFAVVVGMAGGAQNVWVGLLGLAVGRVAAFALSALISKAAAAPLQWTPEQTVTIRAARAVDLEKTVGGIMTEQSTKFRLASIGTVKLGTAVDAEFEISLGPGLPAEELLRQIGRIDGVQDVKIERRASQEK